MGVLRLAVHYTLTVEEKLGDVGHGGGVAPGDLVIGEILQQAAEKEIDAGRGGEIFGASEHFGGDGLGALA